MWMFSYQACIGNLMDVLQRFREAEHIAKVQIEGKAFLYFKLYQGTHAIQIHLLFITCSLFLLVNATGFGNQLPLL